jgi:VIT1/CCC1 family predicted Fe2+/Mn2+ transporter
MTDRDAIGRYRENFQDEVDGAALYRAMAEAEETEQLTEVYLRLAEVEERHAAFWRDRLDAAGVDVGEPRPSFRARVLMALTRRFGPQLVAPVVASDEGRARTMYDDQPEAAGTSLPADERSHARLLQAITEGPERPQGVEGGMLARLEGRHRTIGGNALRAAVLGANDGLVSNLSLVMGFVGAASGRESIVLAGVAGLLAGAGSMALGEWISVQSSRELAERQLRIEREEIEAVPDEERQELELIYQAKGLPPDEAAAVAARIFEDAEQALDVMAREELGIDPEDLGGDPWEAAITSFLLFALGAIVPVLPFLMAGGTGAAAVSVALSGLALFVLGVGISVLTGRGAWFSGLRQLGFGLAAAAVTYGIGALLGVTLA